MGDSRRFTSIHVILTQIHAILTPIHADSRHCNANSRHFNGNSLHFNADSRQFNSILTLIHASLTSFRVGCRVGLASAESPAAIPNLIEAMIVSAEGAITEARIQPSLTLFER